VLDLRSGPYFRLSDAGKYLPPRRGGKQPHTTTLYRWAKQGFRGVKLETIRVGGTLCTSMEALQRFCERLSECPTAAPEPTTMAARRRASERAERVLDRLGF
jgi:hypothetical protein